MNAESAHDLIDQEVGAVVPILSKAPRAQFVAGPGKRFVGGDFSNVEGRVGAWFADEHWKLQAFRDYDSGAGKDLYILAVARAFGITPEEVSRAQRQKVGKVSELAFLFGGSIGAWLRFDDAPEIVSRIVRERFFGTDEWTKAIAQRAKALHSYGLSDDQWIAIKVIVNAWREANPHITKSWWALGDAAIEAVDSPGAIVKVLNDRVQYLSAQGFLWCRLPSGKLLAYCRPRLATTREDYLVDADGEIFPVDEFFPHEIDEKVAAGMKIVEGRVRTQVAYDGVNPKTKAWGPQRLYGGMQMNNVVQATARELLRISMENVEAFDYPIVLHVHDELVAEVDAAFGSAEEFEALMGIVPAWARGLPLVAKAWEDRRYVK